MAQSLSDFLLPETLALLLAQPTSNTPSASARAPPSDSETEDEMELLVESSRTVQVREVFEGQSLMEIVDRSYALDAFVPQSVRDALEAHHGVRYLEDLKGSVIRLDKYHFSTLERCYKLDANNTTPGRYFGRIARRVGPSMCLCIEELTIINNVDRVPSLLEHPAVKAALARKSSEDRDQLFVQRQGLTSSPGWAEPSTASNKRKASTSDSSSRSNDEDTSAAPPSRRPRRQARGAN